MVGLVTVDLLLGAAGWLLWHGVLAAPALVGAPPSVRARLAGRVEPGLVRRLAGVRQVVLVLVALVVGAATHVAWDEFTHPRRWGPEHLPVLAVRWGPLPGYAWAQYASTVASGLLVTAWLLREWRRAPVRAVHPGWPWPAWAALGALGAGTGLVAALGTDTPLGVPYALASRGGAAALGGGVVLAVCWRLRRLRGPRAPAAAPSARRRGSPPGRRRSG